MTIFNVSVTSTLVHTQSGLGNDGKGTSSLTHSQTATGVIPKGTTNLVQTQTPVSSIKMASASTKLSHTQSSGKHETQFNIEHFLSHTQTGSAVKSTDTDNAPISSSLGISVTLEWQQNKSPTTTLVHSQGAVGYVEGFTTVSGQRFRSNRINQ